MKSYTVDIPTPSAKRLIPVKLVWEIVTVDWGGGNIHQKEFRIPAGTNKFLFEGPDELQVKDDTKLDADYYHRFFVEFSNSTGSRTEKVLVQPTPVAPA